MSDLLDATKKAAEAVLAWGEAMAANTAAVEVYRQAQAEAMAEDEARASYWLQGTWITTRNEGITR